MLLMFLSTDLFSIQKTYGFCYNAISGSYKVNILEKNATLTEKISIVCLKIVDFVPQKRFEEL